MGDLSNKAARNTYNGLLKTTDETAIGASTKNITDGIGTASGLSLSEDTLRAEQFLEVGNLPIGDPNVDIDLLVKIDGTDKIGKIASTSIIPPYSSYDSGWINLPTYDGTSGYNVVTGTNKSVPQFRVINRMVVFRGVYYIPLDNGAGGFNTNWVSDWASTNIQPQVVGTGVSIDARTRLVFPPIFNMSSSSVLAADAVVLFRDVRMSRRLQSETNASRFADISGYADIEFNPSTVIKLAPSVINTASGDYSADGYTYHINKNDPRILKNSKIVSGDKMVDFNAFKSSSNSNFSAFFAANNEQADAYKHTIDSNYSNNLGGFQFSMDGMFYTISNSFTIDQIKATVEAL